MSQPKVSDMHGMTLLVKLTTGMKFSVDDDKAGLTAQRFAFVYEQRTSDTGRDLKPRPLWGPLVNPENPNASYSDLLRLLADALDANPPEAEEMS